MSLRQGLQPYSRIQAKCQLDTSAERGVLSTVICMSAGGLFILPLIIFPRVRIKEELKEGAPAGNLAWMQLDIFTTWFEHFLRHAKPIAEQSQSSTSELYISPKHIIPIPKCKRETPKNSKEGFHGNYHRQSLQI